MARLKASPCETPAMRQPTKATLPPRSHRKTPTAKLSAQRKDVLRPPPQTRTIQGEKMLAGALIRRKAATPKPASAALKPSVLRMVGSHAAVV